MAGGKREDLEIVIGANLDGLAADLGKAARMAKGLAKEIAAGAPKVPDFIMRADTKPLRDIARHSRDADLSIRSVGSSLANFATKVALTGGTLIALEAGFQGVADVVRHVKESVVMAAELEQNTIAFEVMQGSAEKAAQSLADLRKFAAETPFSSKEVMQSAKLLTGMGTAAEDLIPQLKMLGHHASIDPKNAGLERMAYLFGTMQTSGRVYTKDLNQLTIAGIEINPDLAKQLKIESTQIRQFAEDGRINHEDVGRAMEAMTQKGGRLYGILDKQANSLRGSWEQMTDAFDMAKIKLGQIIIQESGLKEVVKDLEHFGKRIELGIDTDGLRAGVRFASDLAKAGAQVSYEFIRASGSVASIGLESIGRSFPGVQRAAESISGLLKDMQKFKIDPRQLAVAVLDVSESMALGIAEGIDWFEKMGRSIRTDVLDPLTEVTKRFAQVKTLATLATATWNPVEASAIVAKAWKDLGLDAKAGAVPAPVKPALQIPADNKDVLRMWKDLKADYEVAGRGVQVAEDSRNPLAIERANQSFNERSEDIRDFFAQFKGASQFDKHAMIDRGQVPDRLKIEPKTNLEIVRAKFPKIREEIMGRFGQGDFATGGGIGGIGSGERAPGAGFMGRMADIVPPTASGGINWKDRPHQNILDLAERLKDQFDPLPKLMKTKAEMEEALRIGEISKPVFDQGWQHEVKGVADRLGVGGPAKLTDAVHVGSQEDARLLSNFMSSNKPQTTDDLLRQIRDVLVQIKESTRNMERVPGGKVMDFGGGGDF